MERNRIRQYLVDAPEPSPASSASRLGRPDSADSADAAGGSFIELPATFHGALGEAERLWMASIYERAFLQAEAQVRRACVDRLLESIGAR